MGKGHKDKVAVITGAANGIGQAFAKRLAEDGVHIAIADIAPGDETVKLVEAAGRKALACKCDVTSEQSVSRHGSRGAKDIRPLRHRHQLRRHLSAECLRADDIRGLAPRAVDQSRQLFLVSTAFMPGMKQRGWGRIVSMASSTFGSVVTGFAHYCRARAASSASPVRWRANSARTASPSTPLRRA